MKCKRCGEVIKEEMYETGIEQYCKCQTTIDANFDESLWEKEEIKNEKPS